MISLVNPWYQKLSGFQVDIGGSKRSHETRRLPQPQRGSQALRWMKHMAWVPLKGYPRINQSRIIILTYPGLYKSGHLIPPYPWICKSRHLIPRFPTYPGFSNLHFLYQDIPGYPDLPKVSFFQMNQSTVNSVSTQYHLVSTSIKLIFSSKCQKVTFSGDSSAF